MFQKWSPFAYFSQTNILNYHKNSKKKKKMNSRHPWNIEILRQWRQSLRCFSRNRWARLFSSKSLSDKSVNVDRVTRVVSLTWITRKDNQWYNSSYIFHTDFFKTANSMKIFTLQALTYIINAFVRMNRAEGKLINRNKSFDFWNVELQ